MVVHLKCICLRLARMPRSRRGAARPPRRASVLPCGLQVAPKSGRHFLCQAAFHCAAGWPQSGPHVVLGEPPAAGAALLARGRPRHERRRGALPSQVLPLTQIQSRSARLCLTSTTAPSGLGALLGPKHSAHIEPPQTPAACERVNSCCRVTSASPHALAACTTARSFVRAADTHSHSKTMLSAVRSAARRACLLEVVRTRTW